LAGGVGRESRRSHRVIIGIVALALGAGPKTASNDLYHRIMLALAGAAILVLLLPSGRRTLKR